jgi:hypothetical protein
MAIKVLLVCDGRGGQLELNGAYWLDGHEDSGLSNPGGKCSRAGIGMRANDDSGYRLQFCWACAGVLTDTVNTAKEHGR